MKRKVSVLVSAMILAAQLGSPIAADEPSVEELAEIARYLDQNDVQALRIFLRMNPDLLTGDAQLTSLLREFMDDTSDLTQFFDFEPDLGETVQGGLSRADTGFEPAAGELY